MAREVEEEEMRQAEAASLEEAEEIEALSDDDDVAAREEEEMAEALRLVEEAERREEEEQEADAIEEAAFLKALDEAEAAARSAWVENGGLNTGPTPYEAPYASTPSTEEAENRLLRAEQLAALAELGFQAERALPYCDGRSSVEDIANAITQAEAAERGTELETPSRSSVQFATDPVAEVVVASGSRKSASPSGNRPAPGGPRRRSWLFG